MTKFEEVSLFLLRIATGWLMFYAGITKVLNPAWSAEGYLRNAKTMSGFFNSLANPGVLPVVNFLNEWGLTLIGIALILGVAVRISSVFGIIMMLLYYLPILDFPYPNEHSFIVDEHIIYALVFFVLASIRSGHRWALERSITGKSPGLKKWLE